MSNPNQRFHPALRLLHWMLAICILAMLFIGVGMVSTVMPKYLPLVAIHKSLGIAILVLALIRVGVRLGFGAPKLPAGLPEPMRLAAQLSHYALYSLMIGMPLIGWAMLSAADYPIVLIGGVRLPFILGQSDSMHAVTLGRALLSRVRFLRADPDAPGGGAVSCAHPARRRVRVDGT